MAKNSNGSNAKFVKLCAFVALILSQKLCKIYRLFGVFRDIFTEILQFLFLRAIMDVGKDGERGEGRTAEA